MRKYVALLRQPITTPDPPRIGDQDVTRNVTADPLAVAFVRNTSALAPLTSATTDNLLATPPPASSAPCQVPTRTPPPDDVENAASLSAAAKKAEAPS